MAVLQSFLNSAIDSELFSFKDNTFVAEESDLRGRSYALCSRIYDDACDIGIAIKSAKTGKIVKFYMSETKKDNEGDVMFWSFLPCPEDARNPKLSPLKVIIFND